MSRALLLMWEALIPLLQAACAACCFLCHMLLCVTNDAVYIACFCLSLVLLCVLHAAFKFRMLLRAGCMLLFVACSRPLLHVAVCADALELLLHRGVKDDTLQSNLEESMRSAKAKLMGLRPLCVTRRGKGGLRVV